MRAIERDRPVCLSRIVSGEVATVSTTPLFFLVAATQLQCNAILGILLGLCARPCPNPRTVTVRVQVPLSSFLAPWPFCCDELDGYRGPNRGGYWRVWARNAG
ncbi:hypothetical protein CFAM422_005846 [Trichoderma lentiforme]|uniref:Uncharacterized protein n=1 Tax=Trichoderma lentiforme TaxID=1567552 RepID=A0A9P5CF79_9HYPO|nr:hypothetical protein CFAM422_005846 [Trichoderma lentiforme]